MRCDKSHWHQPLVAGRASKAQEYPDGLCKAICRGLANQKRYDESHQVSSGRMELSSLYAFVDSVTDIDHSQKVEKVMSVDNEVPSGGRDNCIVKPGEYVNTMHGAYPEPASRGSKEYDEFPKHWIDDKHEPDGTARSFIVTPEGEHRTVGMLFTGDNEGAQLLRQEMDSIVERHSGYVECWDDVTGAPMQEGLLRAARDLEMNFFERMGVWAERLPKQVAKSRGGKVIQGRWVDTNKGDSVKPDYRARFVAKEFNNGVDPALFAATPPLEALKLLLAYAASDSNVHVMLSDVKRAYFNAFAQRDLYVELPKEDPKYQDGWVGKLRLALYGTRDAAQLWQECLAGHLESIGFTEGGRISACSFMLTRDCASLYMGTTMLLPGL